MEVDLAPLIEMVLQLVAAVVMALVGRFAMIGNTKFKTDIDVSKGGIVANAIDRGVDYAAGMIKGEDGKVNIYVKNAMVALAVRYVIGKVPETLDHFGITEDKLTEMIESRFSKKMEVEAGPGEPLTNAEYQIPVAEE